MACALLFDRSQNPELNSYTLAMDDWSAFLVLVCRSQPHARRPVSINSKTRRRHLPGPHCRHWYLDWQTGNIPLILALDTFCISSREQFNLLGCAQVPIHELNLIPARNGEPGFSLVCFSRNASTPQPQFHSAGQSSTLSRASRRCWGFVAIKQVK